MKLPLVLLVLALFATTTFGASVFQLDVCNKHRSVSEAPGTSLTVTKDGMCVVTSQVLASTAGGQTRCRGTKASTAVLLRFPCQEEARVKQASGPALNIWGSFEGVPQPTKSGVIVNEAAPAHRQPLHAAKLVGSSTNATNATTSAAGSCSFLTVNPGLYYHRSPPMLTYGYVVSGLPCERAASALATTQALDKAGAKTFSTTYSLWLKPSLPSPPAGMSTEAQTCNLVMSVLNRSYISVDKFPCNMRLLAPEELDDGCCYNAGGISGRRRSLLSRWELAASYRRTLLWLH